MKEMFDVILDKDEDIIKVYKPNKRRFIKIQILFASIFLVPIIILTLVLAILGFSGVLTMVEDGVDSTGEFSVVMLVISLLMLLLLAFIAILQIVQYKKTFYAYSNKRILIRSGFIGVDFTVLEMKLIGATAINVGLLDKFVTPNTGTIRFGSNSTPISGSNQNQQMGGLWFRHIDNAYDTYREIKQVVDSHVR